MNKRTVVGTLAVFLFLLIVAQTVTAAPSAKDLLKEGDNYLKQSDYGKAIESYESILKLYPKSKEAKEAKMKLEAPMLRMYQMNKAENQQELAELIRLGDKYLADGKKDWEEEKRFTGNWNNWRRDSVNFLRNATGSYNKVLEIDPNNAQAQQGIVNVRELETEIQAVDKQGFVNFQSDIAGIVLVNGEQTNFSVAAGSSMRISIDNANGEYTLAVKDEKGKIFPALGKININKTGFRNTYSATVINPNPTPNSGDDFDIRQNSQGGITITGYKGTRPQVIIPDTISGIKVTEIGDGAFTWQRQFDVYREKYIVTGKEIYTVVIPNTVTKIGERAFNNPALKSVVLPNAITTIPKWAFYGCALETITIPNSVTAIGQEAFAKNELTSVIFGNRVTEIGSGAFMYNKLTELKNLPASLKTIYPSAFAENAIATLTIPNGVTMLGSYCFSNNPIKTLVIPSSLAELRGHPSGTMYRVDMYYTAGFGMAFRRVKEWQDDTWDHDGDTYPMNIASGIAITMPANVADDNLNNNFDRTFLDFYKSQNKKAGTYSFDGRLWTVK
jgi:hypothetical protein